MRLKRVLEKVFKEEEQPSSCLEIERTQIYLKGSSLIQTLLYV
jgi:hypothetical protein